MTAWERREGLKRVFVDGGSCFDPISGSTAAQDTKATFNFPNCLLESRHSIASATVGGTASVMEWMIDVASGGLASALF